MSYNELILSLVLLLFLFVLILLINVSIKERKKRTESKQKEVQVLYKVVATTEDLLAGEKLIPFSPELLIVLHSRIRDALQDISAHTRDKESLALQISNRTKKIEAVKTKGSSSLKPLKVPEDDRRAVTILKLIKRIQTVLRSQYGKGRVESQIYIEEHSRLESLRVQLIIENAMRRASVASKSSNYSLAVQLLKKALDVVSGLNDDYSIRIEPELKKKLSETRLKSRKSQNKSDDVSTRKQEIDQLFDDKKRFWEMH